MNVTWLQVRPYNTTSESLPLLAERGTIPAGRVTFDLMHSGRRWIPPTSTPQASPVNNRPRTGLSLRLSLYHVNDLHRVTTHFDLPHVRWTGPCPKWAFDGRRSFYRGKWGLTRVRSLNTALPWILTYIKQPAPQDGLDNMISWR